MKAASISEIKQELSTENAAALTAICLRLARFKKENKELLSYILFESHDEENFISSVKTEMDDLFEDINWSHLYYAKKSLRKIVRLVDKYCRYSKTSATEVELRIHFCSQLRVKESRVNRDKSLSKLYQGQLKKIETLIAALHEDLQFDWRKALAGIQL